MMDRLDNKEWARTRSLFFKTNQDRNGWGKSRQLDYEAGADAILKALMAAPLPDDIVDAIMGINVDCKLRGQVVLIPFKKKELEAGIESAHSQRD